MCLQFYDCIYSLVVLRNLETVNLNYDLFTLTFVVRTFVTMSSFCDFQFFANMSVQDRQTDGRTMCNEYGNVASYWNSHLVNTTLLDCRVKALC